MTSPGWRPALAAGVPSPHLHDQDPGGLVQAELGGNLAGNRGGLDAEVGMGGAAGAQQVADHVDRGGGGDREADRYRALLGRDVGHTDADDLAAAVE
jgi:hypothetical protein